MQRLMLAARPAGFPVGDSHGDPQGDSHLDPDDHLILEFQDVTSDNMGVPIHPDQIHRLARPVS